MVPVAHDHAFELRERSFTRAHRAAFVDHQHSEPVARVQELGSRRMMGRPVRVAPHGLQALDAKLLQSVGQRRADTGVILVIVGSLEEDALAVEEEAAIRVESNRSNAEAGRMQVDLLSIGNDLGHQPIERRRLE